jgi:TolA-binding protein
LRTRAREPIAALLLLVAGCASGRGDAARRDLEVLQAEVRQLRQDNAELARRIDSLQTQLELSSAARAARAPAPARDDAERAPMIPPDLAVVRVAPPAATARPRTPPPVPTSVPIAEPDPSRVQALSRHGRDLAAEAEAELKKARSATGTKRARSLEEFVERYPRHPEADNALVEASAVWAEAGLETQACELADRVARDYPASDALPDAIERLAWCEQHRGAHEAERRLLERLVQEFPRTSAAQRAGTRLATLSGRTGATPEGPARSGP